MTAEGVYVCLGCNARMATHTIGWYSDELCSVDCFEVTDAKRRLGVPQHCWKCGHHIKFHWPHNGEFTCTMDDCDCRMSYAAYEGPRNAGEPHIIR